MGFGLELVVLFVCLALLLEVFLRGIAVGAEGVGLLLQRVVGRLELLVALLELGVLGLEVGVLSLQRLDVGGEAVDFGFLGAGLVREERDGLLEILVRLFQLLDLLRVFVEVIWRRRAGLVVIGVAHHGLEVRDAADHVGQWGLHRWAAMGLPVFGHPLHAGLGDGALGKDGCAIIVAEDASFHGGWGWCDGMTMWRRRRRSSYLGGEP